MEIPGEPPRAEAISLPEIAKARSVNELLEPPYAVLMHNDEVTTFEFVIYILQRIFLLSEEIADHVAFTAHEEGIAIVVVRPRAQAKRLIDVAHDQARIAGYPLTFTLEQET